MLAARCAASWVTHRRVQRLADVALSRLDGNLRSLQGQGLSILAKSLTLDEKPVANHRHQSAIIALVNRLREAGRAESALRRDFSGPRPRVANPTLGVLVKLANCLDAPRAHSISQARQTPTLDGTNPVDTASAFDGVPGTAGVLVGMTIGLSRHARLHPSPGPTLPRSHGMSRLHTGSSTVWPGPA